ncbi:hypothetical protein CQA53_05770 [Helicobacter didelphidarum]|uniref:Protein CR006 P-loop domain-containing protein n=1 Tax=Helicobacter didelphidarum TaxID=2040648 RepID=A0A3D8ILA6_9HELI|nr:AAA family ATPase [Helicobacter didelphidarum]RDU65800.1 hypothetical protein CQA53_05770 [Helicobacter didelphidarum]
MIKKIHNIRHKSFNNLELDSIDFQKINLVFGYNGQGKSSFVEFIEENLSNDNGINDNFECSQQSYKLFIYNEKYKRQILYINEDAHHFRSFYVGDNIRKFMQQKQYFEIKIEKLEKLKNDRQTEINQENQKLDELKKSIASNTKDILRKIDSKKYKTDQSYTKSGINDEYFNTAILLNDNELEQAQKYKADTIPPIINDYNFKEIQKLMNNSIDKLKEILKQTPQNKAIQKFKEDSEFENLAKIALNLKNKHKDYNNKCPLCEQDITKVKLWEKLEEHFNKEYDEFIERLQKAKKFLNQ